MNLKDEENSKNLPLYSLKNSIMITINDRENLNNLANESEVIYSSEKNDINPRNLLNETNNNSNFSSKIFSIFNDIPYLKKLQNYTNQVTMKNNKSSKSNNNQQISNNLPNSNYNFFQDNKRSDTLLHINQGIYPRILIFSDKQ